MLGKSLDDAIEPLIHATQFRAQTVERGRVAHFGGGQIFVAGVVAGKFDACFRELRGNAFRLRQRSVCCHDCGVGFGGGFGLRPN